MSRDTISPSTHCRTTRGPRGEGRLTVLGIVAVCVTGGALPVSSVRANEPTPPADVWPWSNQSKSKEMSKGSASALAPTGDGTWREPKASLGMHRLAYIYEETWFQIACGLSLLGLALAARVGRTRFIRARHVPLQVEPVLRTDYRAREKRAEQGTADLAATNQELQRMIQDCRPTEHVLQEKADQLLALSENIPGVVFSFDSYRDSPRKVRYVSSGFVELVGEAAADRIRENADSLLELLHPEDRDSLSRTGAFDPTSDLPMDLEARIRNGAGGYTWVRAITKGVRLDPDTVRWHGLLFDITDRKQSEEEIRRLNDDLEDRVAERTAELHNSQRRYQALAEASPVGIFHTDPDGNCLYVNERWQQIAGLTAEKAQGSGWRNGIHPEDRGRVAREWALAVSEGRPFKAEYRFRDPEGRTTWVLGQSTALADSQGEIIGYVGTITDISDLTNAETALRKSERRLSEFFEDDVVGLHWVGSDGIILRVNRTELNMLGYTREEYVGHHIAEFHADAEVVQEILNKLAEGEALHDCEARLRCKDGSIRHVLIDSNVLWEDGRFIHTRFFTRDITERKLAQEQARQREVEMAHAGRLATIGEMAAGMAHELNQPLSAIANFAAAGRRILASGDCDPSRLTHSLERIEAIAQGAGCVIRRVRGLAQKREHASSSVDLNQLIRETVELVAPDIRLAMVTLRVEAEEQMPEVQADRVEIQQVVLNLLRNAIEAMKDGGSEPRELCVRTSCVNPEEAEIAVTDTGPGIPSELADRLFDPFVTSKADGLGLGLSISRRIVEKHGGRLWVGSNPSRGCTFHVTLPIGCQPNGRSDRYRSVS